jgi:hypothetical protein
MDITPCSPLKVADVSRNLSPPSSGSKKKPRVKAGGRQALLSETGSSRLQEDTATRASKWRRLCIRITIQLHAREKVTASSCIQLHML